MTKKRKLILSSGLLVSATLATLAVSCGSEAETPTSSNPRRQALTLDELINPEIERVNGNGSLAKFADSRIWKTLVNANYERTSFPYELSTSYGSGNDVTTNSTEIRLVMRREYGQSKFSETRVFNDKGQPTSVIKIYRPTVWRYELTGADAVVLIMKDGTTKVFDSDEAEVVPQLNDEGFYNFASEKLKSNNEKSINSEAFFNAIKDAQKISFRMRKNVFWTNNKGEKTKYETKADDYYIGYLRTILSSDTNFRRNNGGSQTIDIEARKLRAQEKVTAYGDNDNYANQYLLTLYNINPQKILEKNSLITKDNENEFVNFEILDKNEKSQNELFFDYLTSAYEWSPAPSAYIKDKNDKGEEVVLSQKNTTKDAELSTIKTSIKTATGLAKETGIYWYGSELGNTLFAGKFYYSDFDTVSKTLTMKKNTNYWDQTFVDDNKTLLSIQTQYQDANTVTDAYAIQQFNLYQAGDISFFDFSQQPNTNQLAIRDNPKNFGLNFTQKLEKKSFVRYAGWNLVPRESRTGYEEKPAVVNDVFEKLFWNATDEEAKNATVSGFKALKAGTSGYGLAFKTIISAAINWGHVANETQKGIRQIPWLLGLPQDGNFSGKDQVTSTIKTYKDVTNIINSLFAVDKNGEKINIGSGFDITPTSNDVSAVAAGTNAKYQSSAFKELQNAMKQLLDKFYAENSFKTTDEDGKTIDKPIEFGISHPSYALTNFQIAAQKEVVDAINLLDKRIKVKSEVFTDRAPLRDFYLISRTPFVSFGWGVDYDGVGSGLDGFSWNQMLIPVLALILTDTNYRNEIIKSFPSIVRAADKFKEFLDSEGKDTLTIKLEDWSKLTSKQLRVLSRRLGEFTFENGDYKKITDKSKHKDDGFLISAKFWLEFQINSTNEELAELVKQLTTFLAPTSNTTTFVPASSFVNIVVNPNYIFPTSSSNWRSWSEIKVK